MLISFSQNFIVVLPVCKSDVRQNIYQRFKIINLHTLLTNQKSISLFDLKKIFLKSTLFTYKSGEYKCIVKASIYKCCWFFSNVTNLLSKSICQFWILEQNKCCSMFLDFTSVILGLKKTLYIENSERSPSSFATQMQITPGS